MKVVLASESQSRKRALDILGLTYEIHPSTIDEKSIRDTDPAALTKKLAEAKARKVASAFKDAVVVSGDAVVAKHSKISKSRAATTKRLNSYASSPAARSSL
jgi:septum formation protein